MDIATQDPESRLDAVNSAREIAASFEVLADRLEKSGDPENDTLRLMRAGVDEFFRAMKRDTSPAPVTLENMAQELAVGLREVIRDTPLSALAEEPETAYTELACRLIFRLSETLTILPAEYVAARNVRDGQAEAAFRIFNIFTKWLREHQEYEYSVKFGNSSKFELTATRHGEVRGFFTGETVQEVSAQAAQVVNFQNGDL